MISYITLWADGDTYYKLINVTFLSYSETLHDSTSEIIDCAEVVNITIRKR